MSEEIKADKELNIKGEVCPYTFVRSKLSLEEMEPGKVLKVIVDYPPATENVPKSMANEGNEIIRVEKINDTDWEIIVRKGS